MFLWDWGTVFRNDARLKRLEMHGGCAPQLRQEPRTGAEPFSSLVFDEVRNLYGTTYWQARALTMARSLS